MFGSNIQVPSSSAAQIASSRSPDSDNDEDLPFENEEVDEDEDALAENEQRNAAGLMGISTLSMVRFLRYKFI